MKNMNLMKIKLECFGVFLGVLIIVFIFIWRQGIVRQNYCNYSLWSDSSSEFEVFDNVSGGATGKSIVPNYVHFLRYGWWMEEMLLFDAVCILAAFMNQKPDKIFFHTDLQNFTGKYWEKVIQTPGFLDIVEFIPVNGPTEIFGRKFTNDMNSNFHANDILRILILMEYGGIYLDGDVYIVRNLNRYRHYEMTLGWDEGELLGIQILIANKDARFLKLWLQSYRNNLNMRYFNFGNYPTRNILECQPELVYRVKLWSGVQDRQGNIYSGFWQGLKNQHAIDVPTRHVDVISDYYFENVEGTEDLTDERLLKFSYTMRYMVDDIKLFQEGLNSSDTFID